jgi:uncharacterized protein
VSQQRERSPGPDIDPELLERMRRGVPMRMSALGEFFFGDEQITHQRTRQALRAGLDATETGEPTVQIGGQWCYLKVDDCPLRALGVRTDDAGLHVKLDDGRILPLDPRTLWEEPEAGLRCEVPSATSGRPLAVRFTNTAQMDLAAHMVEDRGRPCLVVQGMRYEIGSRRP